MFKKIAVLTSIACIAVSTSFAQDRDFRKEKAQLAREEREAKKRNHNQERLSYGTNIISLTPFTALDIGIGVGASYEKILGADQMVGIIIPVNVVFEPHENYYYGGGSYYGNSTNYNNAYFYFTPGIKVYPFGQRKVTYSVGPNLMIGAGSGKELRYDNTGQNSYEVTVDKFRLGMLINNYLNIQFSKSFNMSMQAGLGVRYIDRDTYKDYIYGNSTVSNGMNVTGQFSVSLGYRF